MVQIPPDNSIVAIRSCRYGTYVTACADHKSVILQKVDDQNKLPQNCLWTLRTEPFLGFPYGSLKFIGCYGRHLSTKGYIWREICQDNPVTNYFRTGYAGWTYDQVGATDAQQGVRLMVALSGCFLSARKNGELCLDLNLFYLCTEPEVYWTIHCVENSGAQIVPAVPHALQSCNDDDPRQQQGHATGRNGISIHVDVPIYNNPMAINTGGNINQGRGQQQNGGVKAGNTKKQYG